MQEEKVPCPRCGRPMKPRHTKGTDFMPRHQDQSGERCPGSGDVVSAEPRCEDCGQSFCHKVAAPVLAEAQPGRPPTDAEVESWKIDDTGAPDPQWQAQASAAAKRHLAAAADDTPYVAALKEQLRAPVVEIRIPAGDEPFPKGPWFTAAFDGECSACDEEILAGDEIRTDGEGGYECEVHKEDDEPSDTPETDAWDHPDRPMPANAYQPVTQDEFSTPAPVAPTPDEFSTPLKEEVKLNVSGQPKADRDSLKRYIIVDPDLGDYRRTVCKERKPKGITRVTTFVKEASSSFSLGEWQKRNVLIGATLRPDILTRVHGLTHDTGKSALDRAVGELEDAAGAKVSADLGTYLHGFTELMDAGLKTWRDAPKAYQEPLRLYAELLVKRGLEPVPGLIERTTFVSEFGGVAGTFDRIFYHRPSGEYIVGDLKTGKTLKYGLREMEAQEWMYAHGVNEHGVFDWNTKTWGRAWPDMSDQDPDEYEPIKVSETNGVIIHMPVQGDDAGQVFARHADLTVGKAYAELCHSVRAFPNSKVRPWEPPGGPYPAPETEPAPPSWVERFQAVTTREDAFALYEVCRLAGASAEGLATMAAIAQEALSRTADKG